MHAEPDFAVFSRDHQLQLVVEVKGTPKSDENWAAKLRRNLLAYGAVPSAPYFLLVLPDHLYLWSPPERGESALPDFRAETGSVLRRYLAGRDPAAPHGPLSERGLELAVRSWLDDLTSSEPASLGGPESDWIRASGLSERVRTGMVESASAA